MLTFNAPKAFFSVHFIVLIAALPDFAKQITITGADPNDRFSFEYLIYDPSFKESLHFQTSFSFLQSFS